MIEIVYCVTPQYYRSKMDEVIEDLMSKSSIRDTVKVDYKKRIIEYTTACMMVPARISFVFSCEFDKWTKGRTYMWNKNYYHSGFEISEKQFIDEVFRR